MEPVEWEPYLPPLAVEWEGGPPWEQPGRAGGMLDDLGLLRKPSLLLLKGPEWHPE